MICLGLEHFLDLLGNLHSRPTLLIQTALLFLLFLLTDEIGVGCAAQLLVGKPKVFQCLIREGFDLHGYLGIPAVAFHQLAVLVSHIMKSLLHVRELLGAKPHALIAGLGLRPELRQLPLVCHEDPLLRELFALRLDVPDGRIQVFFERQIVGGELCVLLVGQYMDILRSVRVGVLVLEVFLAASDLLLDVLQALRCLLDLLFGQMEFTQGVFQGLGVELRHPVRQRLGHVAQHVRVNLVFRDPGRRLAAHKGQTVIDPLDAVQDQLSLIVPGEGIAQAARLPVHVAADIVQHLDGGQLPHSLGGVGGVRGHLEDRVVLRRVHAVRAQGTVREDAVDGCIVPDQRQWPGSRQQRADAEGVGHGGHGPAAERRCVARLNVHVLVQLITVLDSGPACQIVVDGAGEGLVGHGLDRFITEAGFLQTVLKAVVVLQEVPVLSLGLPLPGRQAAWGQAGQVLE